MKFLAKLVVRIFIVIICSILFSILHFFLLHTIGFTSPILESIGAFALYKYLGKKWDEKHSSDKMETHKDTVTSESQDGMNLLDSTKEQIQQGILPIQPHEETEPILIDVSTEAHFDDTPSVISSSDTINPFDTLKKLNELHNEGILTDEEYTEKKKEILSRI
ncbi:MAG: SHOCT domain-containing protein [Clostridia bacterium]|nr:SHOCT domain-containing protein [Clostridia bacterium]